MYSFYIQNIRNNTNRNRTPKWALKAGLVDNSDNERHARKNLWAKRFDERNLQSTHIGANLAEGEEGENYDPVYNDPEEMERRRNEGLWTGAEEEYYNPGTCSALVYACTYMRLMLQTLRRTSGTGITPPTSRELSRRAHPGPATAERLLR